MAQIPGTKYTELQPPSQTGQTLLSPSLASTGGEGAIVSGIGKFGGAVASYALNTIKQEQALDFSERRRQIDEAGWAARNAVIGDEEADAKVWEQFQTDAQAIAASSKWKDVNDLLTEHLNEVSPNWEQGIYVSSLNKRRANAKDGLRVEGAALLEMGNIKDYEELINNAYRLGAITQVERDEYITNAPVDSHIQIAERLIAGENYDAALTELNKLSGMDMTTQQLQQKKILTSTAEKNRDDVSHTLTNDVLNKIAEGMSLQDVGELIRQTVGIDGAQKVALMKTAISADNVFRKTNENPFTVTQDYEKLVDTWYKINKGEIKDFDTLFKAFRSGEGNSPAFSVSYAQWLDNLRQSKWGGTRNAMSSTESKYREKLWNNYARNGKLPTDQVKIFREKNDELTNLLNQYGNDPTRLENEFTKLLTEVKEEKAKEILGNPYWRNLSEIYSGTAIRNQPIITIPQATIQEMTTLDEIEKLPSGTRFIYQGQEYTRN